MTDIARLRAEFLRLLTTDSGAKDRRRPGRRPASDNQAIFDAEGGWAIWTSTDLGMVMEKFDKAAALVAEREGGDG